MAESDKLAAVELGDGDGEDNARRRRHEKLKELLEKMDVSTSNSSPVYYALCSCASPTNEQEYLLALLLSANSEHDVAMNSNKP